jgi:retinol dehydrogenase-12
MVANPVSDPALLPDQSGKVVLVTGATAGIGRCTAQALAAAGATVVVSARNESKVSEAVGDLRARTGNDRVYGLTLDLASFASIRASARDVLDRHDRLDVLVNNAGVYLSDRQLTADGFEATFGINHLGHFLLTDLLLDRLRASAPARVVNLSSLGHRFVRGLDFDDLQNARNYSTSTAYSRSKLANILFTKELARREAGSRVSAFAVHPGNIRSGFGQDGDTHGVLGAGLRVARQFMVGPATGACASVYAAVAPGLEQRSGAYLQRSAMRGYDSVHEVKPSAAARDEGAAARLWAESERLVLAAGDPTGGR